MDEQPKYGRREVGTKFTKSYRVYVTANDKVVSAFHDVRLYPVASDVIINVINEIPRFTSAKMEIVKSETMNPIMQDTKNGKLRFTKNIFPSKGYPWNYGAVPQTWESPYYVYPDCEKKGDNDPLDAIEIGRKPKETGEVFQAKLLGCLLMIDQEECDYKMVVIDTKDPEAAEFNNIDDVLNKRPGLLEFTLKWFKKYKLPDGKPENTFGLQGKFQGKDYALEVVRFAYNKWNEMLRSESIPAGISRANTLLTTTPTFIGDSFSIKEVQEDSDEEPGLPEDDDVFYYVG